MIYLDIASTVCIGLLIGTEFAVSAFINPVLQRLDTVTRMRAISYFAKRLGTAMPFWYAASFVLLIAEASLRWHGPDESLLVAASVLWLVVIVLTLVFLVPINNRMMRLDPRAAAGQSLGEHDRWEMLHRGRVVVLAVSFVCFLVTVLS